jgi:hypothetical protein
MRMASKRAPAVHHLDPDLDPRTKNAASRRRFGSVSEYRYGDSNPGFRTEKSPDALRLYAAVRRSRGPIGKRQQLGVDRATIICGCLRLPDDVLLPSCCPARDAVALRVAP